ncbi:MAG TPA: RagB/SusD family nutrient uptake outer membrane protein, partial [Chitinophagaceae bacterium]
TIWAAKGLLAKVYLTLNKKAEAITVLQDIITNSGHALQPTYAAVFNINNEMNSEIIFAVRYKAGGLGLGSTFGNTFGPLGSASNVINGDGDGLNYPTADLDTLTNGDNRKPTLIGVYQGALYVKKYLFPVTISDDGESDWPILRYADVLLMLAEAQGYTQSSLDLINQTRQRAGLGILTMANTTSLAQFEQALSTERRIEFAFENQRWFDLVRYNTTMTTVTAEQSMKDHYADEYYAHYRLYLPPTPTLSDLQGYVKKDRLLLPIPQREIDTNTQLTIAQNPDY